MSIFLNYSLIMLQLGAFFTNGIPNFYQDQFSLFEEKGFTREMIEGARPIYHNASFYYEFYIAEMQLWTIIGKDVYMERNPHASINSFSG